MFYDRFCAACANAGMKPSTVLKAAGKSPSRGTEWKTRGTTPRMSTICELAKVLGCNPIDLAPEAENKLMNPSSKEGKPVYAGKQPEGSSVPHTPHACHTYAARRGTMFYNNLVDICAQRGTNLSSLLKGMGKSPSRGTEWRNGAIPRINTIEELAVALDCSVQDLMDKPASPDSRPQSIDQNEDRIIRLYRAMPNVNKAEMLFMIERFAAERGIKA